MTGEGLLFHSMAIGPAISGCEGAPSLRQKMKFNCETQFYPHKAVTINFANRPGLKEIIVNPGGLRSVPMCRRRWPMAVYNRFWVVAGRKIDHPFWVHDAFKITI